MVAKRESQQEGATQVRVPNDPRVGLETLTKDRRSMGQDPRSLTGRGALRLETPLGSASRPKVRGNQALRPCEGSASRPKVLAYSSYSKEDLD